MKTSIMTTALLMTISYCNLATAHDQSGTLGTSKTYQVAQDTYAVSCGPGSTKLFAQVIDRKPVLAPTVSIQLEKTLNSLTEQTKVNTDATDGNAAYSTGITLKPTPSVGGGSTGVFKMIVTKSQTAKKTKGAEIYNIRFHCQDASNGHTDTSWEPLING
jgi:hypothetical protein